MLCSLRTPSFPRGAPLLCLLDTYCPTINGRFSHGEFGLPSQKKSGAERSLHVSGSPQCLFTLLLFLLRIVIRSWMMDDGDGGGG